MITKEYLQQELVKRIDGYKRGVETTTDNIITEMKSILVLVNALPYCEKKYNKAIERMRKMLGPWRELAYNGKSFLQDLESIFPELRESEDEKIRRTLVEYFGPEAQLDFIRGVKIQKIRDWLEKQKDHFRDDTKMVEKQDYSGLNDLERAIHRGFLSAGVENVPVTIIKETANECKRTQTIANENANAEWSEEDENIRKLLIWQVHRNIEDETNDLAQSVYDGIKGHDPDIEESIEDWKKCLAWLKSLRPSWKPSKEQMGALNYAYCELFKREDVGNNILGSLQKLLDDLKKLM